jgi:hypothetical protein
MSEESAKRNQSKMITWLKAGFTGLAVTLPVVGSVYLFKSLTFNDSSTEIRSSTTGIDFGSTGDRLAANAETAAIVKGVGGDATVNASRNVYLFSQAFRPKLVSDTEDFSPDKKEIRDRILNVIERLVTVISQPTIGETDIRRLADEMASIMSDINISPYHLIGDQFTLEPGTAYYLPGGTNALAFIGPADDKEADGIFIRRNGRKVVMKVGSVRTFSQQEQPCRLVLHEVAERFVSATFSYTCKPQ